MKKPVIALAPIKYFDLDEHNLEKIKKYIYLAKKSKADIVCFPESCIHRSESLYFEHELIKEIQAECRRNKIWCIIVDDFKIKGRVYNSAILINRRGLIEGHYNKIHLYGDDTNPGQGVKVFKTDFAKIGIVICWDMAFPELFRKLKKKGAQIVFCPSQWAYEKKAYDREHSRREAELLRSIVSARAFENIFYMALCNPLTDRKDFISYSAIASPHRVLKENSESEELMVQEINLAEIKKLEKIYKKFK